MELHDPGAERMAEGGDLGRLIEIGDQHSEYRRRQAVDDHRRVVFGEILTVNRKPKRKSQIANAALLKHLRFSGVDHPGNLDQVFFEHSESPSEVGYCPALPQNDELRLCAHRRLSAKLKDLVPKLLVLGIILRVIR